MITLKADTQQRGERIQTEAHRLYLQVCLAHLYNCIGVLWYLNPLYYTLFPHKKEAFRLK